MSNTAEEFATLVSSTALLAVITWLAERAHRSVNVGQPWCHVFLKPVIVDRIRVEVQAEEQGR